MMIWDRVGGCVYHRIVIISTANRRHLVSYREKAFEGEKGIKQHHISEGMEKEKGGEGEGKKESP